MRAVRSLGLAAVAGIGIALLALAAYHLATMGDCGSGSTRYGSLGPCRSNSGAWIGALAGSVVLAIVVTGVAGAVLGPPFALAVGGAMIVAVATGATNGSWLIAAVVLAVIFTPIGVVGLWRIRGSLAPAAALPGAALLAGAVAGTALALAIPGPLREPKRTTFTQLEGLAAQDAKSYFNTANLTHALQTVRAKLGAQARIESMDLRPGIAVITAVSGGTEHDFSLRADGSQDDFTSAASSSRKTVPLATIDAAAPHRLLAQLKQHRIDEIDFAIGVVTGTPEWHAHVAKTDITRHFTSDAHGRGVKPPSDSG